MTENEFWKFIREEWAKGRIPQVSGRIDSDDSTMQEAGEYFCGHAMSPSNYDKIPEEDLKKMSNLLFQEAAVNKTKEVILIILAHQSSRFALMVLEKYCLNPDEGLEYFVDMALSECEMWNE